MTYTLGARSRANLQGVHPALTRVVERAIAITGQDFAVIEGVRSVERQRELLAKGHTRTMNSRHITGHAVDLAPWSDGGIDWNAINQFRSVGHAMLRAAQIEGVSVTWGALKSHGGMWLEFNDMPHFQIPTDTKGE